MSYVFGSRCILLVVEPALQNGFAAVVRWVEIYQSIALPISFKWKSDATLDVGFDAEDVARVNPLFATYNDKGQVEGVKYDRLSVAFVNAFKEQQAQIERQQKQIDELKRLVCLAHPTAEVCKQ